VNPDWRTRYDAAVEAAARAARVAMTYFDGWFTVEWKDDQSPVTVADREAERSLRDALHAAFPADGFLGEEYGDAPGTSGYRWIIDPIDGTRSFVRGIPIWATLVGLEHRGEQIAGVAVAPALRETWRALRGDGAYRNDKRVRVSDINDLSKSILFYTSLSWFLKAGRQDQFLELVQRTEKQRGYGDFYGHVLVAQGAGEVMVEHGVHAWDVAALKPLVEEAGGRFTTWSGGHSIFEPDVVASNGQLHDAVLAVLGRPPKGEAR
jgi:histidinol-phosphatase